MKYLLYLLALPALAQFSGLTTTPDGSKLYFTSTLRQHNTDQPLHGKLFSLDDREVKPIQVIPNLKLANGFSNFYDIESAYLDERGQLAGTYANRTCFGCRDFDGSTYAGTNYTGRLILSPNRRYALQIVWASLSTYRHVLHDLSSGQVLTTANEMSLAPAIVSNSGLAWRATGSAIQRLSPGDSNFQTIFTADRGTSFSGINLRRDSDRLLAIRILPSLTESEILELDPTTRSEMKIPSTVPAYCIGIDEARNQALVALCASERGSQLLKSDVGRSSWNLISPTATFIKEWTLSADGNVIWYLTRANAFHKHTLLTQTDETRLPPIGSPYFSQANASPGSLFFLEGDDIEDYRLQLTALNSPPIELRPQSTSPHLLTFRIPLDLPTTALGLQLRAISNRPSLFEIVQPISTRLELVDPAFFALNPATGNVVPSKSTSQPIAARQDFSALITPSTPARSQEILHLWATNLGPVSTSSGTITTPGFACFAEAGNTPLEVLYAGLAPTLPGIYQVTLRLPSFDTTARVLRLNCSFPNVFPSFLSIPVGQP